MVQRVFNLRWVSFVSFSSCVVHLIVLLDDAVVSQPLVFLQPSHLVENVNKVKFTSVGAWVRFESGHCEELTKQTGSSRASE